MIATEHLNRMKRTINHKIAILLATHNGLPFLNDQFESILRQSNISIYLFISDDCSQDSTLQQLQKYRANQSNIKLLPSHIRFASAGKNFYRLLRDVDFSDFDFIAFADQDDIWQLDKLQRHAQLLRAHHADLVASNVIAFWPDGRQKLINKSQPQRQYDYLFESCGPGCTFLMTPWLANEMKRLLLTLPETECVEMHDWLTYAVCRANQRKVIIDDVPSVMYRQHQTNVVGANSGLAAYRKRFGKIYNGWYRHQVLQLSKLLFDAYQINVYKKLYELLSAKSFASRISLLPYAIQGRRKLSDRLVLLFSIMLFIF